MFFVTLMGMLLAAVAETTSADGSTARMLLGTAAMTVAPAAAASLFALFVGLRTRKLDAESPLQSTAFKDFARRYARMLTGMNAAILGSYAVSLFAFGWPAFAYRVGATGSAFADAALRIAPFVVSLLLVWIPLHYADALMRPFAPTLAQRLAFNIRQYILTLMVPIGALLGAYDLYKLLPEAALKHLRAPWLEMVILFAAILAGYTLAPIIVVRLWKTRSLPRGPIRERLASLCSRAGVRFRDIRVWETPGHHIVNAAVMGIAGFVRYIIVSRTLLEVMAPDEVEAVFAHELGHARRRHMIYYLLFAANFVLLVNLYDMLTPEEMRAATETGAGAYIALGGALLAYWGLGFGYVSRAFERDGDLYAADMMGGHKPFASALMSIAHLNGINPASRSWRHGSIASRVKFLEDADSIPAVRKRFLMKVDFLKAFLVLVAALSLAGMALAYTLKDRGETQKNPAPPPATYATEGR